jgi:hypothetical protein
LITATHNLLVGGMATLIGCLLILGALLDAAALMKLTKVRLLAESIGKPAARIVLGCVGVAVIALGVLIASG